MSTKSMQRGILLASAVGGPGFGGLAAIAHEEEATKCTGGCAVAAAAPSPAELAGSGWKRGEEPSREQLTWALAHEGARRREAEREMERLSCALNDARVEIEALRKLPTISSAPVKSTELNEPATCVGESSAERESIAHKMVVSGQIRAVRELVARIAYLESQLRSERQTCAILSAELEESSNPKAAVNCSSTEQNHSAGAHASLTCMDDLSSERDRLKDERDALNRELFEVRGALSRAQRLARLLESDLELKTISEDRAAQEIEALVKTQHELEISSASLRSELERHKIMLVSARYALDTHAVFSLSSIATSSNSTSSTPQSREKRLESEICVADAEDGYLLE